MSRAKHDSAPTFKAAMQPKFENWSTLLKELQEKNERVKKNWLRAIPCFTKLLEIKSVVLQDAIKNLLIQKALTAINTSGNPDYKITNLKILSLPEFVSFVNRTVGYIDLLITGEGDYDDAKAFRKFPEPKVIWVNDLSPAIEKALAAQLGISEELELISNISRLFDKAIITALEFYIVLGAEFLLEVDPHHFIKKVELIIDQSHITIEYEGKQTKFLDPREASRYLDQIATQYYNS